MNATESGLSRCPYCREEIQLSAVKCRHCGEFLRGYEKREPPKKRFRPGERLAAAFISLFVPGLGQACKGQIMSGALWFFMVGFGYWFFIVPGLLLHIACVAHALDPNKEGN